jgi:hypothetical protein
LLSAVQVDGALGTPDEVLPQSVQSAFAIHGLSPLSSAADFTFLSCPPNRYCAAPRGQSGPVRRAATWLPAGSGTIPTATENIPFMKQAGTGGRKAAKKRWSGEAGFRGETVSVRPLALVVLA